MDDKKIKTDVIRTSDVVMPKLTQEQEDVLRERFRQEALAAAAVAAKVAEDEEGVYTNVTPQAQYVHDLGWKTGDIFSAECFAPSETKDLRQGHGGSYKLREIRASKHLAKMSVPGGPLAKGRVAVDASLKDLFGDASKNVSAGRFDDPLSGKRPYDLARQKIEDDEMKENGDHLVGVRR